MAYLQEYDKLCMLGQGGFATIYKVRHRTLGYVRAIKVSKSDINSENDRAYQTFLKECRVLLKIGNGAHPNIVRIYQPRLIDNKALVEMDYVRGCTLNEYLKQKMFIPIDEVMQLIREIGSALAYCHHDIYQDQLNPLEDHLKCDPDDATKYDISDQKRKELIQKYRVIHNDLHSNNIMRRDYDGGFVLLDFGLAIQDNRAVKSSSRQDGAIEYISPEKWDDNKSITTQSDIYSLGIIIYEALTGHVPFVFDPDKYTSELQAKNDMSNKHHNVTPPEIGTQRMAAFKVANPGQVWEKDYPDWLEQMVMICLAKDPVDRYADAKEFMNDFNRHLAEDQAEKKQEDERKAKNKEQVQQLLQKLEEMKSSLNKTQEQLVVTQTKSEDLERDLNLAKDKQKDAEKKIQLLDEEKTHFATEYENLRNKISQLEAHPKVERKVISPPWTSIAASLLAMAIVGAVAWAHFSGFRFSYNDNNLLVGDSVVIESIKHDTVYVEQTGVAQAYEEQLEMMRNKMAQLNDQLREAESKNLPSTGNNAEVSQLQSKVATLSKENASLKSKVSTLQSQNKKLQEQVNAFIKNLSN